MRRYLLPDLLVVRGGPWYLRLPGDRTRLPDGVEVPAAVRHVNGPVLSHVDLDELLRPLQGADGADELPLEVQAEDLARPDDPHLAPVAQHLDV